MRRELEEHNREVILGLPVPLVSLPTRHTGGTGEAEPDENWMITASAAELRDSELRYRRLFEAAQDGILLLSAETGRIYDVNPFLLKLMGYSHGEVLNKYLWDIGFVQGCECFQGRL